MVTRRNFLINSSLVIAAQAAKSMEPVFGQTAIVESADNWPPLTEEEKQLLRIPLSDDQAKNLLKYKVNREVFDKDKVVGDLKAKNLMPPVIIAKTAMAVFDGHIIEQYHKPHQINPWDEHPNEPLTVGSLWRRFWEHASNHYHEANIKSRLELRSKYPGGPATYPERIKKSIALETTILGESNMREVQEYAGKILDKANPDDKTAYAMITRKGPMLDFPHIINELSISRDLLNVHRSDLAAIGIDVDAELKTLSKTREVAVVPGPWTSRLQEATVSNQKQRK
jgi:hypothetical protein